MELVNFRHTTEQTISGNLYLIKAVGGLNKEGKQTTLWILAKEITRFEEVHDG